MNIGHLQLLSSKEQTSVLQVLKATFSIQSIPGLLFRSGKDRLFLYTGNLSFTALQVISDVAPLERAGVYIARMVQDGIRLTLEGVHFFKNVLTGPYYDLTKEQAIQWMKGEDLFIRTGKKGFFVMRYHDDILGCGKASFEKIGNYVQKSRRLKR